MDTSEALRRTGSCLAPPNDGSLRLLAQGRSILAVSSYRRATFVLAVLLAVACARPAPAPTGQPGPGAAVATKDQLIVRLWDNPQGFDPATLFRIETETVAFNLYNGLTTYEAQMGEIIPDLAERWETADVKAWTFHLRKGVQWQGGYGELTSRDVVYSYLRVLDPGTASPYRGEFANVEDISAPDAYTVVIRLKAPDANFLHQVASYHQGQVVKQEAVEKFGDQYQMNPIGTGPFVLERFVANSEIVLTRHDGYFRGPAKLQRVIFRIIKDDSTAEVALKNREVDIAGRIAQNEILERLQKDDRFTLYRVDGFGVVNMMLNSEYEPFAKPEVRKAIAHAVDWEGVLKATTPLTTTKPLSMLPAWMSAFTDQTATYPYDPERARTLLRSAGYPDGFTFKQLTIAAGGPSDVDLLVKDYLSKVGITMELEMVETTVSNQRRNRGDFHVASRLLPAVNPDTILFSYLHPANAAPSGLNGARYNNPQVTSLLEEARAEANDERRIRIYHEIQRLVMEDLPYIPRSQNSWVWPAWNAVKNVVINKLADVDFWPVIVEAR